MSYDQWKQDAPDPGTGGPARSLDAVFWRAYDEAVRWNLVAEFLNIYRPMPAFADLVRQADAREREAFDA